MDPKSPAQSPAQKPAQKPPLSPSAAPSAASPSGGESVGVTAGVTGSGPGRTGVVTLDRPKALNALNRGMVGAVAAALDTFAADDTVRQVLIRSSSPKAFCAGGDVRSVRDSDLAGDSAGGDSFFTAEYDLNHRIATFPKPVVSLVDGLTMGGGLGLSLHASHRIITDRAWASMPEAAIGFVTDVGISHVFTHLPALEAPQQPTRSLGLWLAVTAYRLTPGDLLWTGLATGLVADVDAFTTRLFTDGVDRAVAVETVQGRNLPSSRLREMEGDIRDLVVPDGGWAASDSRIQAADGQTAELTRKLLEPANPLSLEATARLLDHSSRHTLREALDAEFSVGCWARSRPNFAEGVRAVLVDKTRDAVFTPADVAGITDADRAEIEDALDRARKRSASR